MNEEILNEIEIPALSEEIEIEEVKFPEINIEGIQFDAIPEEPKLEEIEIPNFADGLDGVKNFDMPQEPKFEEIGIPNFDGGLEDGLNIEELDIEDVNEIIDVYERCCKMQVGMRHPYAGKLVFTAFSGSHQDAINKGEMALAERGADIWEVPYLPIDPADVGRKYEPVVRINSQSGKGGVAFIMSTMYGYKLPKAMHREFADVIQKISETDGGEIAPERIMEAFREEYLSLKEPYEFISLKVEDDQQEDETKAVLTFKYRGTEICAQSIGRGPIDAVKNAICQSVDGVNVTILDYDEHALSGGSSAKAAAYIHMKDETTGRITYGVGVSGNITRASIRGIFSALNRLAREN
jgi:2-isopropylmalate synthase